MKQSFFTLIIGSALMATPAVAENNATTPDSSQASKPAASAVVSKVAELVKATPEKAGEIVKSAIVDNKADAELVAEIVVAAVTAAPEQIDAISVASMAVAPDAFSHVVLALAKLDGFKFDEVAQGNQNPLDSPGEQAALRAALQQFIDTNANVQENSNGGRTITIRFLNAVRNPASGSPLAGIPALFTLPKGLFLGTNPELIQFTYDDEGNTTGIIIETSPTAP